MPTTLLLFSLAAILSLFHMGRGNNLCSWSQRMIPKKATGDITLEVPIVQSYWTGYLGNEQFGTYGWAKGWCSYSEGYFRCPYTAHDGYYATSVTLPNVEKISYAMLESEFPVTIHKPGDESIPGFYVEEGQRLDICTDGKSVHLEFLLNGKESDLQDILCFRSGRYLCSGLRRLGTPENDKCAYSEKNGRLRLEFNLDYKYAARSFVYCYANWERTRALTYIIAWKGPAYLNNVVH
nr:unnamed protein product [Spirometra erinaceieuropaei]